MRTAGILAAVEMIALYLPAAGQSFSSGDPFRASVPQATASPEPLQLTLQDAIDRGLKYNLGLLVRSNQTASSRAERLRALSELLPTVNGGGSETAMQLDLATFGFHFPGVPSVIGPFSYTDIRANADAKVFDWSLIKKLKASTERARAAQLSEQDGRDLVVQTVASGYLAILAGMASADATSIQVQVAEALYQIARDRHSAGVTPAIDELRSRVELQTQRQQLLLQQNQVAKDKLALARVIGLAQGQVFNLADTIPYRALDGVEVDAMLRNAYATRADYQGAQALVRAAELQRQSTDAERYPTISFSGSYGDIGPTLGASHGTFTAVGTLKFNIFDGGRIRSEQQQAESTLKQRKDDLEDLKGRIDYEVRTALLDLRSAADRVAVARDNVDLANQTLDQARDRFSAGVTGNIEVVQAQEALVNATQNLISSEYAHNLAKVALARAAGMAEGNLNQFIGSK